MKHPGEKSDFWILVLVALVMKETFCFQYSNSDNPAELFSVTTGQSIAVLT